VELLNRIKNIYFTNNIAMNSEKVNILFPHFPNSTHHLKIPPPHKNLLHSRKSCHHSPTRFQHTGGFYAPISLNIYIPTLLEKLFPKGSIFSQCLFLKHSDKFYIPKQHHIQVVHLNHIK